MSSCTVTNRGAILGPFFLFVCLEQNQPVMWQRWRYSHSIEEICNARRVIVTQWSFTELANQHCEHMTAVRSLGGGEFGLVGEHALSHNLTAKRWIKMELSKVLHSKGPKLWLRMFFLVYNKHFKSFYMTVKILFFPWMYFSTDTLVSIYFCIGLLWTFTSPVNHFILL